MGNKYTDEEMLDSLRQASERVDGSLSQGKYSETGMRPSYSSIIARFGSWNDAKELAGLSKNTHKTSAVEVGHEFLDREDVGAYERIDSRYDGDRVKVYVHRLVAVAEYGIDQVVDSHVHHESGHGLDNRPGNLTLMTEDEHKRLHANRRERNDQGDFV